MKVAILSFFSGKNNRGVERWVEELSARLSGKYDVFVYQNWAKRETKYKVVTTNMGYDLSRSSPGFLWRLFLDYKSLKIADFALKILPNLWRENFDIIIPTDGGWEPAFIRLVTWIRGSKMVIVGHSGVGWDDRNNLFSLPDCFVALSKTALSWCKNTNPLVKAVYIPNGVDMDIFKNEGEKVKINLKEPVILAVGALEKSKRFNLAIAAVAMLKDTSLLILGEGIEENNLLNLGKRLLGKKFMLKKVSSEEILKYYRSCDLFTLPSWERESFGIVYLEALSSGLPVVATDDETRREIVGDAGVLVDPTDTKSYAEALEKALNMKWGNKPRKQAEKFSWDKIVTKYEELFQELSKGQI